MGNKLNPVQDDENKRVDESSASYSGNRRLHDRKFYSTTEFSFTDFVANSVHSFGSLRSQNSRISTNSVNRPWSRVSRRQWKEQTLSNPFAAAKTAWPVPFTESLFLPTFSIRNDISEDSFDIIGFISRGAFGVVSKVVKKDIGVVYAMKVLSKAQIIAGGAVQQVKDEVRIQQACGHHELIVNCPFFWQSRKQLFIVSDFVPGGEMLRLLQINGPLSEDIIRIYLCQLAVALDFLHNAGIIYRDLKLENILLDERGRIQLVDFGLAKWLKYGTRTKTLCGTLQYIAPEVLLRQPYGHSADWWSLGIVLSCMILGHNLMDSNTQPESENYNELLFPQVLIDEEVPIVEKVNIANNAMEFETENLQLNIDEIAVNETSETNEFIHFMMDATNTTIEPKQSEITCEICSKTFANKNYLKKHSMSHIKPYSCEICSKSFRDRFDLKAHTLTHGRKKKTIKQQYSCNICQKVFRLMGPLQKHLIAHSEFRPYTCEQCNKSFKRLYDLKNHKLTHSDIRPFSCDECNRVFRNKNGLRNHQAVHNKQHICNICDKVFRSNGDLQSHWYTHSDNKPFSCTLCKKTFVRKENLLRHGRVHIDNNSFFCELCKKTFRSADNFQAHNLTHENEKSFSCNICSETFTSKNEIQKHLIKHKVENKKCDDSAHSDFDALNCKYCKTSLSRKFSIKTNINTTKALFQCDFCGKMFPTKQKLERHVPVHFVKKKFSCEVCKMKFKHKHNLNEHSRVHNDNKPFSCNICSKSFHWVSALNKHKLEHGETNIHCDYGNISYSDNEFNNLKSDNIEDINKNSLDNAEKSNKSSESQI